ncbi:alpha 1,6 mannosyltransferase [Nadsonia fulvescens var. elongata DSM 6958]|uniref:Alpha 1,6 mannosyltransferase n=1 Tax=Nadsonia fulvescens var. elongata DSM 6958 TaxID=857566 RepID=A0A1E3PT06_9ASCO|nr:alpha 1,6 mannosyltransferase [Nadsonia fulvescens var. elongata DSM 6958]
MRLTFIKALSLALTALTIIFFFVAPKNRISPAGLLPATEAEINAQIRQARGEMESALEDYQRTTEEKLDDHNRRLEALETERRYLEKQLSQLKRLPTGASIREQLSFQFPYDVKRKFPAYIWQTWKQNLDDPKLDPVLKERSMSWRQKNGWFVHEVLSDDTAHALIQHLYMNVPDVIEAYNALPLTILKADFFRYLILLARGGVYSDFDTENLKPIPNWIPNDVDAQSIGLIVGIEADPDRPDWKEWYARRIQFCQWTIQAKPGHPVLREIVSRITEITLDKKKNKKLALPDSKSRGSEIMDWTGPGIWTDSVFEYFGDSVKSGIYDTITWKDFSGLVVPKKLSDVLVLPITSFSPGVGTMGAQDENHPLAFVKHHFEGSWKPESERHIGN